jgi:hypothetical protein
LAAARRRRSTQNASHIRLVCPVCTLSRTPWLGRYAQRAPAAQRHLEHPSCSRRHGTGFARRPSIYDRPFGESSSHPIQYQRHCHSWQEWVVVVVRTPWPSQASAKRFVSSPSIKASEGEGSRKPHVSKITVNTGFFLRDIDRSLLDTGRSVAHIVMSTGPERCT